MKTNEFILKFLFIVILSIILLAYTMYVLNNTNSDWEFYLKGSWALGVVIPNGAKLEDGTIVRWSEVKNITAIIKLPQIIETDGVIYIVLSAMTQSKTILQVAIGIEPNRTTWLTYAMIVTNISSGANYTWITERGPPSMNNNDLIIISIYLSLHQNKYIWSYKIHDITTNVSYIGLLINDNSQAFMDGEQEVIALESYTKNEHIFMSMGNITLYALFLNNKRVVGGWYFYDGWDWTKHPLFVIGSIQVPNYISISSDNNTIYWRYNPVTWGTPTITTTKTTDVYTNPNKMNDS
ncbi:MAG: hypothetical protein QW128_01330 [Thermoprotei archaeon]